MNDLPTPSAWRYTHKDRGDNFISYGYSTERPKNCHHPMPMFTQGQMNQYGQICFEGGREARAMVEPMDAVAIQYAHRMALELECVLSDGAYSNKWYKSAMQVLSEYRSTMNEIHKQHSPTFMGEPRI